MGKLSCDLVVACARLLRSVGVNQIATKWAFMRGAPSATAVILSGAEAALALSTALHQRKQDARRAAVPARADALAALVSAE